MKTTKVNLREKPLKSGMSSLYLDFYPAIVHPKTGKSTRREFLSLYVHSKPRTPQERQHNKDTRLLAESHRTHRQKAIQNDTYGNAFESKKNIEFLAYYESVMKTKKASDSNYSNWLSAYKHLQKFTKEGLTMLEVNRELLEGFKEYLLYETSLSQNTALSYHRKLLACLKLAYKQNFLKEDFAKQVEGIKPPEPKREFLLLDEIKLLIKTECEQDILKRAFLFSCFTGLRFGDVQALTWNDLQGNQQNGYFIRYKQEKTKAEETLPLSEPAVRFLGEPKECEEKVFKGLKYSAWTNLKLREWVMKAGIRKKITFHCARHSFATLQLTLGADIYTVSKLLGHKEVRTTQIYAKVIDSKKNEAMNLFNDLEL